jgi:4-amino-4-deoxy-L-arabinose transferase-like glycosyltransferase
MYNKIRILSISTIVVTLIISCFPLFIDQSNKPIELWDESRNACNALEMYNNHNYSVRYFEDVPDTYELKPPMLIWLQVISFKIFGVSEFSMRFPVFLSILLLLLGLMLWFYKDFNLLHIGVFASLIIICSDGIIERHIGRTGDHEGLLLFLQLLGFYVFYKYCEIKKDKLLFIFWVLLTFSVLTKSIVGLFFIPGCLVYSVYKKRTVDILNSKWFYIGLFFFLLIISIVYYLRELQSPGYIVKVWNEELFVRYINKDGRYLQEPFWYYLQNFYNHRFMPFLYLLPLVIPAYFFVRNKQLKDILIFSVINIIIVFIIISQGCKNLWYDAPLYPLMAIAIGISIWSIIEIVSVQIFSPNGKIILYYLVAISLSFSQYLNVIIRVSSDSSLYKTMPDYSICFYLKDKIRNNNLPDSLVIVYSGYRAHILYYKTYANKFKNTKVSFVNWDKLSNGSFIITSEENIKDSIKTHYKYEQIDKYLYADMYKIIELK